MRGALLLFLFLVAGCLVEPEPEFRVGTMEPGGYKPVFFAEVRPGDDISWTIRNSTISYTGSTRNVVVMEVPDETRDWWWVAECSWAKDSIFWMAR